MFESLSRQVTLHRAVLQDCRHIWKWRNERRTRAASFSTDSIPYEEHKRWFSHKLNDPHTIIFIVTSPRGRKVGYVRFDIVGEEAQISVSIDKNERHKGYGTAAIQSASNHVLAIEPVCQVVAHIRRDNPSSIAAFKHAGFVLRQYKLIAGIEACEMRYAQVRS